MPASPQWFPGSSTQQLLQGSAIYPDRINSVTWGQLFCPGAIKDEPRATSADQAPAMA
jgi:hypothetical protein